MDPSKTFDRLRELPDAVAVPLRRALEKTASFEAAPRQGRDWSEEEALYLDALDAAGLPRHPAPAPGAPGIPRSRRTIPHASDLAPAQRVLAEILAHVVGPDLGGAPVPASSWVRRQWLGLDPAGPLFAIRIGGEPAYHAVREAAARGEDPTALMAALPTADRIALLVDLQLAKLDCAEPKLGNLLATAGSEIDGDGGWAPAQADRLLALFAPGVPRNERGNAYGLAYEIRRPVFLALVRAGVPIEPRWDALLPLGPDTPAAEVRECVDAIPPERREAALDGAARRLSFQNEWARVGTALLASYPVPALARFALEGIDHAAKPKEALAQLEKAAAGHPAIEALVAAKKAELAGAASLVRGPVRSAIPIGEMSAIDRARSSSGPTSSTAAMRRASSSSTRRTERIASRSCRASPATSGSSAPVRPRTTCGCTRATPERSSRPARPTRSPRSSRAGSSAPIVRRSSR